MSKPGIIPGFPVSIYGSLSTRNKWGIWEFTQTPHPNSLHCLYSLRDFIWKILSNLPIDPHLLLSHSWIIMNYKYLELSSRSLILCYWEFHFLRNIVSWCFLVRKCLSKCHRIKTNIITLSHTALHALLGSLPTMLCLTLWSPSTLTSLLLENVMLHWLTTALQLFIPPRRAFPWGQTHNTNQNPANTCQHIGMRGQESGDHLLDRTQDSPGVPVAHSTDSSEQKTCFSVSQSRIHWTVEELDTYITRGKK